MIGRATSRRAAACPSQVELEEFRLGNLNEPRTAQIEAHVETCEICWATIESNDDRSDPLIEALTSLPCTAEDELEYQRLYQALLAGVPQPADAVATTQAVHGWRGAEADEEPIPERLGVYCLETCIGRGAHGAVYIARHEKLDRTVAIKILRSPKTARELRDQAVDRFLAEMRAVGKLDHPNIIRATDADEVDGFHYLVMEYIPGIDVAKLTRHHSPLRIADACEIARQAALALAFANQHQMVHRDVKPSNLLVTWNGVVKMLDLGLVAIRERHAGEAAEASLPHGTADYMSPEQWTQYDAVDIRADLYSLGCTLYRLLSGRTPFQDVGVETAAKRNAHLYSLPAPVRQWRGEIPPRLGEIVDRLLTKHPEDRCQRPEDLAQWLSPWCSGADLASLVLSRGVAPPAISDNPSTAPTASWAAARQTRRRWLQVGLVAMPLAALASYPWWRRTTAAPSLRTDDWRDLLPVSAEPLISLGDDVQWERLTGDVLAVQVSGAEHWLLELGTPLRGRFQFRCLIESLAPGSAGGIFMRYQRARARDAMRHAFITLEWSTVADDHPVADGSRRQRQQFRWQQYELDESGGSWSTEAKPWAECQVAVPSGGRAPHELLVRCGRAGIPELQWDGQSLFEADWNVTSLGRIVAQTREEKVPELFCGRLGFYVSKGSFRLLRPQLKYET